MEKIVRRLFSAALVLLALSLQLGCGPSTPAEYIAEAREYIQSGEFESAKIELSNALLQDPKLVEARVLLAEVSLALGDGAKAEKEITRALDLGLSPESGQLLLVKSLVLQGDAERVLAETRPIDINLSTADRAAILGIRGQIYAVARNFDAASLSLGEGLELDANSVPVMVGMSLYEALLRDYPAAIDWAERAVAVDESSTDAWSVLGQIHLEQGNAVEAEAALSKAVKLSHFAGPDLAKRAMARTLQDNFSGAQKDIDTLLAAGLKNVSYVNYVAGVNYFRQEQFRDAADAFEASRVESPLYLPREYYLASTHMKLGNFELARRSATVINNMLPQSASAKRLLGAVQINQSELQAATQSLNEARRDAPEDVVILRMLGYVSMLLGNAKEAVDYYQSALELEPDTARVYNELAMARLLAGQELGPGSAGQFSEATADEKFTSEFLAALALFRDNRLAETLKKAADLHLRYPDNVNPVKLMAVVYLRAAQWDTARKYLEKTLEMQPNEPSAARNLAILELRSGQPEVARELLRGVVATHPGNEEAVIMLARLEKGLGHEATGIQLLEQGLETNPESIELRGTLAAAYLANANFASVLEITRDLVIEDKKDMARFLKLRGETQMQMKNMDGARRTYLQWIELDPGSAYAHFLYAENLMRSGDLKLAGQEVRRSLALDPKFLLARVGEIKILVHKSKLKEAKARLAELGQEFGDRADVLGIQGWFALGTRDFTTAAERYGTLLERQPTTDTMILYIRSLWGQKQFDVAVEKMRNWLADYPDDIVVGMHLAGSYLGLGRESDAQAAYKQVVDANPGHVPALNNLAWLLRESNLTQALDYAERANQISPRDPAVMDTLGTLLIAKGDTKRGHRYIVDAAERAPADLNLQLHVAKVYLAQGNTIKAKAVLERIVAAGGGESSVVDSARELLDSI